MLNLLRGSASKPADDTLPAASLLPTSSPMASRLTAESGYTRLTDDFLTEDAHDGADRDTEGLSRMSSGLSRSASQPRLFSRPGSYVAPPSPPPSPPSLNSSTKSAGSTKSAEGGPIMPKPGDAAPLGHKSHTPNAKLLRARQRTTRRARRGGSNAIPGLFELLSLEVTSNCF